MTTWRRRLVAVAMVVGATSLGHLIASTVAVDRADDPPFIEQGELGDTVRLSYADVRVTDARPALYLGSSISSELAVKAGGVWVIVSATATASREPTRLQSGWLEATDGTRYRASGKSRCATGLDIQTGVPVYSLWCFDVPADQLAGLHFLLARGDLRDPGDEEIDGDAVADIDLGVSAEQARTWADTDAAYRADTYEYEPIELTAITLNEVDS